MENKWPIIKGFLLREARKRTPNDTIYYLVGVMSVQIYWWHEASLWRVCLKVKIRTIAWSENKCVLTINTKNNRYALGFQNLKSSNLQVVHKPESLFPPIIASVIFYFFPYFFFLVGINSKSIARESPSKVHGQSPWIQALKIK